MLRRLRKERRDLFEQLPAFGAVADDDFSFCDGRVLLRLVVRAHYGPYEGLPFVLVLRYPEDYPFSPPEAWWATPIAHPNVTADGYSGCCLGSFGCCAKNEWSPVKTVRTVAQDAQALLNEPNFVSTLNHPLTSRLPNKDHLSPAYQRMVRKETLRAYPRVDDLVVAPEASDSPLWLLDLAARAACDAHGGAEAAAKAAEESGVPEELTELLRSARRCHICGVARIFDKGDEGLEFEFRGDGPVRIRACSQACKQRVVDAYDMDWEPDV